MNQAELSLATSSDIVAAAELARARGRFGIDTEFMSEGRYRALLCLVQVVVDDPDGSGGIRINLIDGLDHADVTPLAEVLAEPGIEVVLHAGRQDVAILRRAWSPELTNIFDPQLAAGFAGASAQAGYGTLIGAILGHRVGKTASYTRWDARPLTSEQLNYAAEDVAHLLELADELQRRLHETGRLEWAPGGGPPRPTQPAPRPRAAARELPAWRERTASAEDRPVGSVLADPPLVELAKRQPTGLSGLEQIRGIHPSGIRRRGQAIIDAIARGRQGEPIPRDEHRGRSEPSDAPMIALAEAL